MDCCEPRSPEKERDRATLFLEKKERGARVLGRGDLLRLNVKDERAKERRENAEPDEERSARFFRFQHRRVILGPTVGEERAGEKISGEKGAREAKNEFGDDSERVTSDANAGKRNARRFRRERQTPSVDAALESDKTLRMFRFGRGDVGFRRWLRRLLTFVVA